MKLKAVITCSAIIGILVLGVAFAGPEKALQSAECAFEAGLIEKIGALQNTSCVHYYFDAGKTCTDGSQCSGDCVAKSQRTWLCPNARNEMIEYDEFPESQGQSRTCFGKENVKFMCERNDNPFGCRSVVEDGKVVNSACID